MKLMGKVALITGASRGIGAAVAERFAAEGAKVAVNYRSSVAKANEVVGRIRAAGGEARAFQADMSDLDATQRLVSETVDAFGQLDILVNNAGRAEFRGLADITPEHVRQHLDLNVTGLIFATQHAVKRMGEGGRIVNLSSIAARGGPGGGVYGATKAAVNTLTKSFAKELGPKGITVNAVAPGAVETDMYVEVGLAERKSAIEAETPLGRVGVPGDVASAVLFLASEEASWVTGEIFQVSGGRWM